MPKSPKGDRCLGEYKKGLKVAGMFASQRAMEISSLLGMRFHPLVYNLARIQFGAIKASATEVEYFRNLFPELAKFLNQFSFGGLYIKCQVQEVHQKPIVHYGKANKETRCELGDYFVNVKYYDRNKLLGRKLAIYQFKMAKKRSAPKAPSRRSPVQRWTIDPKQLTLLRDWPPFTFGKAPSGYNTFILSPQSADLGSYWLAQREPEPVFPLCCGFDLVAPAMSAQVHQQGTTISFDSSRPQSALWLCGSMALALQMMWRYGEPVDAGTPVHDFLEALYRFVGLSPDPPEEFDGFMSEPHYEKRFWGIEICIRREAPSQDRG